MSSEPTTSRRADLRLRMGMAAASVAVGLGLLGAKFYAYHLTRSSAILSDALESIVNVAAAVFALYSIFIATRPADECHPYGHGKIEYFSGGFEGALIILAAIGIFRVGWQHLVHPQPIPQLEAGALIVLFAALVNLLLGIALIRIGRRTRSLALEADGHHLLTDVYTSAGVLVGLLVVRLTGWLWVDGAVAFLVGANVLWSGGRLIRQSFRGLMNAADPMLMNAISRLIVENRRPAWINVHRLRAWRSGAEVHIDLHLILPKDMSLEDAHFEADFLEKLLLDKIPGAASVLVHMDACRDGDCPVCGKPGCTSRKFDPLDDSGWSGDDMVTARQTSRR
ncbi:MAG: cation diffusion facilitator family transporter [Desulfobacterales bacterium]